MHNFNTNFGKGAKLTFTKELYPKEALIKAAFNFTDRAFIHLDADERNYIVTMFAKQNADLPSEQEFLNEILAQTARLVVLRRTRSIRELLLARAFASSIITDKEDDMDDIDAVDEIGNEEQLKSILKDWFATNEN